ncbi:DsbC family protein, partial [Salmonella enterica]|nr:DsbC family protein [Salmonella enterica subsp. enterica serovar 4,[5],12:i:-]EEH7832504.1 DsbC family protein [Salmonella enterica]
MKKLLLSLLISITSACPPLTLAVENVLNNRDAAALME